ncbi:hypothetical protein ACWDWU_39815 [Streptomyces sp. NPDC003442]
MTFTATVTPIAPGAGVPTGTVTFSISGSGGGTFTQPLSGGMAVHHQRPGHGFAHRDGQLQR